MNEILVRLATATLLLSVSAVVVQGLMLVLRPSSAGVRQCAWFCVLIQGIVLFHLPVRVPWCDPPPDDRIGGKTQRVQQLFAESPSETTGVEAETAESALATPAVRTTWPSQPSQVTPERDWSRFGVALWASGIAGLIIFSGLSYALFLRQLAQGRPGPSDWAEELRELLEQRGVVRTISLLVTRSIGPALCWAPWSYRICVPGLSWAKLASAQRSHVLRHELAHFERADLWRLLLVRLLALPHWFNPFAWWAVHEITQSVEWACDQEAAGREPEDAVALAKALMQLGVARSLGGCAARAAGRSSLYVRIRRLMLMNSRKDSLMKEVLILAVAASLVVVNLVRIELVAKEPEAGTPPLEAAPARPDALRNEPTEASRAPVPTVPSEEMVVAVRIDGNRAIGLDKILPTIRTRAGRLYSEEQVQQDVKDLYKLGRFASVRTFNQRVPGGVIVTFQMAERPLLREVIIVGNDTYLTSVLKKEAELKVGDAADPFAVENGRRKIVEYYQKKGYSKVGVSVLEGNKAGDLRAVFVVNEGPQQKVFWVKFVGNNFISSARLKTIIDSHRPWFYLFAGEVDYKQIDEDVAKLTAYYRSFGFYFAKVGRELESNEKRDSLTITFVITEGPRYCVRNISFVGDKKLDSSRLTARLKLLSGQYFDQNQQNLDLQTLGDEYGGDGYVFAKIKADNRLLEEPGKLDIVYNVEEGSRYRVGRINIAIKGETPHTQITTVLNRLSFKPGDIVDTREFRASERRLKAAQLYKVEPQNGIEAKIVYSLPKAEDKDTSIAGQRRTIHYRVPGGQAPLPPGEGYLDVNVAVECQGPETVQIKKPAVGKIYIIPPVTPGANPEQEKAIAEIKKLGGRVNVDETSPSKPVKSVGLAGSKVTDAGLEHLKDLTKLQSLRLFHTNVTDAGLTNLKGLTQLHSLILKMRYDDHEITDAGLANLKGLTKLRSLHLINADVTDAGLANLRGLSQLQSLGLASTKVTCAGLVHLRGLSKLQWLGLTLSNITDAGLENLKGLPHLQSLALGCTNVTDAGLLHLEGLSNLQSLGLGFTKVTDAGLVHLRGLSKLQLLDLEGTKVTDAGLANITGLSQLQSLELGPEITDAGLEHLRGLSKLQSLVLLESKVTDAGLANVKGLTQLKSLSLVSTKITDAGLVHLRGLSKLRSLDLMSTKVTDAGLANLSGLTQLKSLTLGGTKVTDAGLVYLKELSRLDFLNVTGCKVTEAGVNVLQKALPNCEIMRGEFPTEVRFLHFSPDGSDPTLSAERGGK